MEAVSKMVYSGQTLATIGKEIHQLFVSLSRSHLEDGLEGYSPAAWDHEAERFGLWANNLGLYHRGHSSLDYRLREADALKRLIGDLLGDLKTSLYERKHILSFLLLISVQQYQNYNTPRQIACHPTRSRIGLV